MIPHAASDFAADTYDLGYECQRIAARLAVRENRYADAINEYMASIEHFRKCSHMPNAAKRIAEAELEIARLGRLVAKVGAP
jgi:hypothetical protein